VTTDRFERYKDALRRGHVAMQRERFGEAINAYEEAAELAPERAVPHSSVGRMLIRLGRPADALAAFARALERAPADEVALTGRAEVLVATGRPMDAAETLARLAESQAAAGKLAEATNAARQALELAESRQGRRFVERLVDQLRDASGDAASAAAMERALRVLEPPAEVVAEPEVELQSADAGTPVEMRDSAATDALDEAAPDVPAEPATPPPERLVDEAEALAVAGHSAEARERYLAAASAYRGDRRLDAAVDACLTVLRFDPADPAVHLLLADLYVDHGWRSEAAAKLNLVLRLSTLTGDAETERLAGEAIATRLAGVTAASGEVAAPG
jgi:tetratricopeptide (TPR) repeat protein